MGVAMTKGIIRSFLLLALLVFAAGGHAVESGPSNTVGFWKLEVHPGFTQVSFPLLPANKTLNNVLGNQLTGAATAAQSDQIHRWNPATGQFQVAWYNTGTSSWEGGFSTLSEAESYWIYVPSGHPATQTLVTFGNVVESATYNMGTMIPGYNAVGSVWASPASLSQAGLTAFQGGSYLFLSDLILSYDAATGGYSYAWRTSGGAWQGTLSQFEPLKGYWIYVAPGHTGFTWSSYPHPLPADAGLAPSGIAAPILPGAPAALPAFLPPAPQPVKASAGISPVKGGAK
ncbi:MAG: hypothetical protein C4524_07555 [Candidatus Zixiibacteriota bacterium]|nr:MAG: hypothetical protein C4524_07555 [candidate division Zixibacteria bacterium]